MPLLSGVRRAVVVALLALVVSLCWAGHAAAQGPGLFVRPLCSSLTNPVAGQTWCFESSTLSVKVWNGTAFTSTSSTILNGLAGTVTLQGTTNQINVVTAGAAITLSGPQSLAPGNTPSFGNLFLTAIAPASPQCLQIGGTGLLAVAGFGCGRLTSVGGQTGPALTLTSDTNVTLTAAANAVIAGWTGTLAPVRGGFGADMSAASGVISFNAGARVVNNVLTATRLLYAGAGNTVSSSAGLTFDGSTLTLTALGGSGTRCLQVTTAGVMGIAAAACGGGGGGLNSIGAQIGPDITTVNDTNVTLSWAANVGTLGWTGVLARARGGTNAAAWTTGHVAFADATSLTGESALFWDAATKQLGLGVASTTTGRMVMWNSTTANSLVVQPGPTSTAYVWEFPDAAPGTTECLQMASTGKVSTSGATCGGGGGSGVTSINVSATGGVTIQGTANQVSVGTAGSTLTLSLPNPINVNTTGNAATATTSTGITGGAATLIPFWLNATAITNDPLFSFNASTRLLNLSSTDASTVLQVANESSTVARFPSIRAINYLGSTNGAATFEGYAYRGSSGAPAAVQANDILGLVLFRGGTGSGSTSNVAAELRGIATETFTGSTGAGALLVKITSSGATTPTETARFTPSGLTLTPALTVPNGGTGVTAGTSGGVPYFSSTTTMASSAILANHGAVVGGGAGAAPRGLTALTNGQLYIGSTGADPVPGAILSSTISSTLGAGMLTLDVTGILGGVAGRVPYWTSATAISNSSGFVFDAANVRLLVGGALTPARTLHAINSAANTDPQLRLGTTGSAAVWWEMGRENLSTGRFRLIDETGEKLSILNSGNVGIGTVAPAALLDVRGLTILSSNAATLPSIVGVASLQVSAPNTAAAYVLAEAFGAQGGLIFRRANGTPGARTALVTDNLIGAIEARGAYDATNYSTAQAALNFLAGSAWTGGSRETYFRFDATPLNSTTLLEVARMRATGGGQFSMGRTTTTGTSYTIGGTMTGAHDTSNETLIDVNGLSIGAFVPGIYVSLTDNGVGSTTPPGSGFEGTATIPILSHLILTPTYRGFRTSCNPALPPPFNQECGFVDGAGATAGGFYTTSNIANATGHVEVAALSVQLDFNSKNNTDASGFGIQIFGGRPATATGASAFVALAVGPSNEQIGNTVGSGITVTNDSLNLAKPNERLTDAILIGHTATGARPMWTNAIRLSSGGVDRFVVDNTGRTLAPDFHLLLNDYFLGYGTVATSRALNFAGVAPNETSFGWSTSAASFGWRIAGSTVMALDNGAGSGLIVPKLAGGGLRVACVDNNGRIVAGASGTSC